MKIDLIAGARPNFMKISPIIDAIKEAAAQGKNISYRLIHTGQHYDPLLSGPGLGLGQLFDRDLPVMGVGVHQPAGVQHHGDVVAPEHQITADERGGLHGTAEFGHLLVRCARTGPAAGIQRLLDQRRTVQPPAVSPAYNLSQDAPPFATACLRSAPVNSPA